MSSLTIPAAQLGDNPDRSGAVGFWTLGYGSQGLLVTGPTRWTVPRYTAKTTTPKVPLWPSAAGGSNAPCWQPARWTSIAEYAKGLPVMLPWGPGWRPADGTDAIALVDISASKGYEVQNLRAVTILDLLGGLWWTSKGQARVGDLVCDQLHLRTPGPETDIVRGAGKISKLDGTVTVEMIDNGIIPTAIACAVRNNQYGPGGAFVAPATRKEHPNTSQRSYTGLPTGAAPGMNPEGMRFRLDITDAEIDAWLDRRGYTGPKRRTARIFAIALRDYGWFDGETCDQRPQLETEGCCNPDTATRWRANGLVTEQDFATLLDGLITLDRLRVVNAA